ncbi:MULTISPECIES: DNA primase [Streptococcus]|uniref:DNA primase n=1 Tax=Streptococcus TaxID=1301 RepID=UPI0007792693|nr:MULTISPECIES: DNA primase [Streptococcus]AMP66425.1 DNA primase [Streptococcus sp. A12]MCF4964615.1 DNA primase [Streptococcus sp. GS001]RSK05872.1 DNA primase [Streptococcus sp. A12]RSK11485.1 DNA primase [Streptococcus australis]
MVDKQLISEIKNSVNIVDVIGEVVQLTKAGRNFLGLCPFHGEKTPSFNVVEDKQFYHCFGCGRSGDVFKFIEDYRGVSFMEAVQIVGDQVGIRVQTLPPSQSRPQQADEKQPFYEIHQEAAKFYHAILMTTKMGEEARQYLYDRGLDDEVLRHFQIGLAPAEGNYLLQSVSGKFSENILADSGLFHISDRGIMYDAFQDRIMFPLSDDTGRVIAFSGRLWRESAEGAKPQGKYKNSRGTLLFNKSYELYHLDKAKQVAKKNHELYLMEGFMDVIAAYRAGIENAVASMGTALTQEHVAHLSKFTKKVILAYDGDKAGRLATAKALEVLEKQEVEVVQIPDQMDPDEYLNKNSPQALADLLEKTRLSRVEFLMDYWKPDNIENLQAQIEFVEKMAPLIAQTPSVTAQNTYIYKLADLLVDFDYMQVEQTVNASRLQMRSQRQEQGQIQTQAPVASPTVIQKQLPRLVRAENHLLHRMNAFPYVLNEYRLRTDFSFDTPALQTLYQLLCQNGEVTSQDLSEQTEEVQRAWYLMMEENLPDEIAENELEEVEETRNRELLRKESQQIGKKVREASHSGDADQALLELERLIAQKRRME